MKIPVSNKSFIDIHEDTTLSGSVLILESEDKTFEISERELIGMFHLINWIYSRRLTLEDCLVYLPWYAEIEELASKQTGIYY